MPQPTYVFRQPESVKELISLLHLRYRVFRESRLKNFVQENETGLDLDCYDLNSLHFGVFRCDEESTTPVGYVRLITDEPGPFFYDLIDVANEDQALREKVLTVPKNPFPVMNYTPYTDEIKKVYSEFKNEGKRIIETGRFSIEKSERNIEMAAFMINSVLGVSKALHIDAGIHSCVINHCRMYNRFGFEVFPGTDKWYCSIADNTRDSLLLLGIHEQLPALIKEKVTKMAEEYEATGRICHHPAVRVSAPRQTLMMQAA